RNASPEPSAAILWSSPNTGSGLAACAAGAQPDHREVGEPSRVSGGLAHRGPDAVEDLGRERHVGAAALAAHVLTRPRLRQRVEPGPVSHVHVSHETERRERLEVAIDGREVAGWQPPVEAARDVLGADG